MNTRCLWFVLICCAAVSVWAQIPTGPQQEPAAVYLLKPTRVFDGESASLHQGWVVLVRGERIQAAGTAADVKAPAEAKVIEMPGTTLLPGLIEGHSHILLHAYSETSWNDQNALEALSLRVARATNHLRSTLMAGFTTIRDLGTEGAGYADVGLKQAVEQSIIPGPRMLVVTRAIVATGSYGPKGFAPEWRVPQGAEEADGENLIRVVRDQIGKGADWIKVYADYVWGPGGIAAPTFSLEELKLIVDTAKSSGRAVAAHASTPEGMRRATLAGQVPDAGDHAAPDLDQSGDDRVPAPLHRVRTERVALEREAGQQRGRQVAQRRERGQCGVPVERRRHAHHPQQHDGAGKAERVADRTERAGHGVRRDQPLVLDDVRDGGAEPGEEEPVEADNEERQHREQHALVADPDHPDRGQHEGRAQQVGRVDDRTPAPPVQEHTDVRADQRVRQQQYRETGGDGDRAGLLLRVEQHAAGEPRLEPAVGHLADDAYPEQAPESALGQDRAEVVRLRVVGEGRGGHDLSVPVDLGPFSATAEWPDPSAAIQLSTTSTRRTPSPAVLGVAARRSPSRARS